MENKNIVLEQLSELRVIPVIRTKETENAVTAVLWLREAGFRTFEITLTTPDAINIIVHIFHPDKRKFYDLEKMWSEPIPKEKAII